MRSENAREKKKCAAFSFCLTPVVSKTSELTIGFSLDRIEGLDRSEQDERALKLKAAHLLS